MGMMIQQDQQTMSTREIAELTGKQHGHVKRDFEKQCVELGTEAAGYIHFWKHPQNQQHYPEYILPKQECLTLVSGYSVVLRNRIIQRWEELEQKQQVAVLPDFSNPAAAARAWAEEYEQKLQVQREVKELKPKADFHDTVTASDEELSVRDAAKLLNIGEKKLFQFLRNMGYLMTTNKDWNKPYQRFIDQKLLKYKIKKNHRKTGPDTYRLTMVTGKGLSRFSRELVIQEFARS